MFYSFILKIKEIKIKKTKNLFGFKKTTSLRKQKRKQKTEIAMRLAIMCAFNACLL